MAMKPRNQIHLRRVFFHALGLLTVYPKPIPVAIPIVLFVAVVIFEFIVKPFVVAKANKKEALGPILNAIMRPEEVNEHSGALAYTLGILLCIGLLPTLNAQIGVTALVVTDGTANVCGKLLPVANHSKSYKGSICAALASTVVFHLALGVPLNSAACLSILGAVVELLVPSPRVKVNVFGTNFFVDDNVLICTVVGFMSMITPLA